MEMMFGGRYVILMMSFFFNLHWTNFSLFHLSFLVNLPMCVMILLVGKEMTCIYLFIKNK
jgi:hypothetical protein